MSIVLPELNYIFIKYLDPYDDYKNLLKIINGIKNYKNLIKEKIHMYLYQIGMWI